MERALQGGAPVVRCRLRASAQRTEPVGPLQAREVLRQPVTAVDVLALTHGQVLYGHALLVAAAPVRVAVAFLRRVVDGIYFELPAAREGSSERQVCFCPA